jgi:release factor glutamine methyltransferase
MLIRDYRTTFIKELTPFYDAAEAESFFYLILENKRQLRRIDLALQIDLEFTAADVVGWDAILEQLKNEIPIQYILGMTNFYGLDFEVNENVLIPRPETEELVEWIISNQQMNKSANAPRILDIGTGSGCIAIALAKNIPGSEVFAIDVSEMALATSKKNAECNKVSVTFLKKDILKTEDLEQQFDIIVSNPPYVRMLEQAEIRKNVLDNEPHLALFVEDDDALVFYRKIAALAKKNLSENGCLYFEINQYLGREMVDLLSSMNYSNIELRKDIYGNDRMVISRKS